MGTAAPEPPKFDGLDLSEMDGVLDRFGRIEDRFLQLRDGLNHLQRLATLGTLTATVAHEFNNILTPILSYAELALSNPENAELARKAHEKALAGAQRASLICSSLLGYTREGDQATCASLPAAVNTALGCLGGSLAGKGIRVELDLPEVDLAIRPINLEQVLVNLLLNARKAMAGRGGTLSIRARVESGGVRIDVADTGRGVPPEVADRLFEPFVTHNPDPDKPQQKGTGLGLSVCRDLIESAGGRISFTSSPGEGTTFHLLIPQAQPQRRAG